MSPILRSIQAKQYSKCCSLTTLNMYIIILSLIALITSRVVSGSVGELSQKVCRQIVLSTSRLVPAVNALWLIP